LHNEELNSSYTSKYITKAIKSTKMKLAGHVAWTGEMRNGYNYLVGKPERK
jgi:hypothetical protein